MIPTAAMKSGIESVEAIEPNATGGPDDGDHENQPDVVCLPDRAHRAVGVVADRVGIRPFPRGELPPAGAEVGSREHGVEGQSDEREQQRQVVEMHGQGSSEATCAGSIGARARRRRIQATASASAR